jgi:uncharacterized protein YlaN (UPF0358 family)
VTVNKVAQRAHKRSKECYSSIVLNKQQMLNFFKKPETQVETVTVPDAKLAKFYLETLLSSLPRELSYSVKEELKDGMIVTHKTCVDYETMKSYVRSCWIDSHPAKFIITCQPVQWVM